MTKTIRFLHILSLAVFAGSIPTHILLGQIAIMHLEAGDTSLAATYRMVLDQLIHFLTLPGLGLLWLSGLAALVKSRGSLFKARWIRIKLGLAALITVNGVFMLAPLASDLALHYGLTAATGTLAPEIAPLTTKEDLFGTFNLLLILAVCALACYKPGSRSRKGRNSKTVQQVEQISAP